MPSSRQVKQEEEKNPSVDELEGEEEEVDKEPKILKGTGIRNILLKERAESE